NIHARVTLSGANSFESWQTRRTTRSPSTEEGSVAMRRSSAPTVSCSWRSIEYFTFWTFISMLEHVRCRVGASSAWALQHWTRTSTSGTNHFIEILLMSATSRNGDPLTLV